MKQIVFPITSASQPEAIANLHEGLLKLGLVITKTEINGKSFGRTTVAAIRKLQVDNRLTVNGEIDAATAARLNQMLKRKGAFGLNGNIKPLRKAVIKNDLWKRSPAEADKEDAATVALVDAALNDYFIESLADAGVNMDDKMKAAITELKVDLRGMEHIPVSSLFRETILPELMKKEELKKQATLLSRKVASLRGKKVGDLLQLQKPLKQHPAFQKDMLHTRNAGYAGIFKLSNALADKMTELDIDITNATNDELNDLAAKQLVDAPQLNTLKLSGELARLTDDNLPLVGGLQKRNIQSVAELANIQKADWLQMINNERAPLPPGTTADEYADRIIENIDHAFPTKVLLNRVKHTPTVGNFIKNNPDLELAFADFFADTLDEDREAKINWTGISAEEKPAVRKQMMAYQRVLDLGDDVVTRSALLEKGFDSAFIIADMSEAEFVKKSGMKKEDAKRVYAKATDKTMMAAHQWAAIRDVAQGGFKDLGVSNLKPTGLLNDLKDIDGMAELFGSQDYCDCSDCRSIFSPAAYFTDLMYFVEKNITTAAFDDMPNHPINLRTRRPDLWNLHLTCKSTNTLIPYLDVVNEVLETFLEKTKGIQNLFQKLSLGTEKISFHTPFNLPLEETRTYLDHFSLKRADILTVLRKSTVDIKQEYLKLSKEEFDVITQPAVTGIEKRYGDLANVTIADVVRFAGITRKNLDELLALRSTDALKNLSVETTKGANDIQPTGEKFKGLTKDHLDFMHRFVRLWKKVPYTIPEFDLVLHAAIRLSSTAQFSPTPSLDDEPADIQLNIQNNGPLNPVVVLKLATLIDIGTQLKLKPEELCSVTDILPSVAIKEGDKSIFTRLFDYSNAFKGADNDADYHHYARNTNNLSDDQTDPLTPILLNGLGISETDLVLLFEQLQAAMQFDADGKTKMNRKKVSLLYRHARIAKALKLSIPDVITLIKLAFPPGKKSISSTANIKKVIEFRTWMKQTPFSLSELWFLVNQESIGGLQTAGNNDNVIAWAEMINGENRLSFTADGLLKSTGITKEEAEPLLKAFVTAGLAKANGDKYLLLPAYSLTQDFTAVWTAMNATDKLKAKESDIRSFFNGYHPKNVWQQLLAETLGAGSDLFQQLAAFLPAGLTDANYFDLLNSTVSNDDPAKKQLIEKAAQQATQLGIYILLFEKLKLKMEETAFVLSQPALFGLSTDKLSIKTIASINTYKKLSAAAEDADTYLHPLLISLHTAQAFNDASIENYATLTGKQSNLVRSLVKSLPLSTDTFDAISHMQEAMAVCDNLGINGYSLSKLAGNTFDECTMARDIIIGAFGKYADETDRAAKMEPYKDTINVKKRDTLCAYVIALQKEFKFEDHSQLYSYFLLDVDTGGCFRTSKVVAAISSVQLYVHRCLLNLEQSGDQNNQIADADVMAAVKTKDWEQIVQEWEWRKNYRVWEANRKVFLYPENYIEPDLRDNKTALFKELEEELLQVKITKESAEEAYKKYLTQFAELSKLKIAGSYYHEDTNTYYFFGCTHIDPYQYYVREWRDCKEWTAWEKVSLSISTPNVGVVMHLSKLYVFWVDINVREMTKVNKGNAEFDQYEYSVFLNYSYRNENGKWSAPQKIRGLYDFHHKTVTIPEDVDNATMKENLQKEIEMLTDIKQTLKGVMDTSAIDARINELQNQQVKLETEEDMHEFAVLENKNLEDMMRFYFEHGKSYRKCYPLLDGNNICLEYAWMRPWVEMFDNSEVNPYEFGTFIAYSKENSLNLFHNRLEETDIPHEDEQRRYLKTRYIGNEAALVLKKFMHKTEGRADIQLEVYSSGPSDIKLTADFDYRAIRPEVSTVNSSYGDYIVVLKGQSYLVKADKDKPMTVSESGKMHTGRLTIDLSERTLVRLSTTLADELGMKMLNEGIDAFMELSTQQKTEKKLPVTFNNLSELLPESDHPTHIDFRRAYGEYYRELFFHIPFLIANHLNANGKFEEAKYWYEKIFNPTASEDGNSDKPTERNWRYVEFRNLHIDTLKEILTDQAAIAKYKEDPFNPHAIARLRLNAYQKCIVMKYIDNLVDWGDHLFTRDTMESINEATMLYTLAADILGKRPASLGKCETVPEASITYAGLKEGMKKGSEFLITMENWQRNNFQQSKAREWKQAAQIQVLAGSNGNGNGTTNVRGNVKLAVQRKEAKKMKPYREMAKGRVAVEAAKQKQKLKPSKRVPGYSAVQQSRLAFCIPPNYDLHKYWDRVEDRLFKIRNCMNIQGIRRQLALFAPPIDPMMLVRARAAGLSLDDVLNMLSAQLPSYRFSFLVEKAKQYAGTVQSFGSSLLSALEKKDVEELTLLRSLHEQNLLKMMRSMKTKAIDEARTQLLSSIESRTKVYNLYTHYLGLINEGLNGWEVTQQVSRHIATGHQVAEAVLRGIAGVNYLIPQLGSPFALKWGGKELGDSLNAFADLAANGAKIAEAISTSAGLEATFQRREEEWTLLAEQAEQELKAMDQQIIGFEIKVAIAEKDLEQHDKQIEQAEELHNFYKDKFTNLGLYTHLASTLNKLYRQAYNIAFDMARMAEQAYRFECDDDTFFIGADNWQFDRAGLLAGEKLMLQLQQMEKSRIEKDVREKEITQTFSMQLLAPAKLLELRQKGVCDSFEIPEMAFDLFYPGQYKRLIKSVRITIPCIAGAYSNISCKLTLLDSKVRKEANATTELLGLATQKLTSITTSGAQNDSGLFDLNFKDEKYLPFEGAGAISNWRLELPSRIRTFDYNSISDVIFHISYTAKDDGLLKEAVEQNLENVITDFAAANGLFRLFSLKNEFPEAWHRLLNGGQGVEEMTLVKNHFPFIFSGKDISLMEGRVFLRPAKGKTINTAGLSVKLNNFTVSSWSDFQGNASPGAPVIMKEGTVGMNGDPVKTWTIDPAGDGFNKEEVEDMFLLLRYNVN